MKFTAGILVIGLLSLTACKDKQQEAINEQLEAEKAQLEVEKAQLEAKNKQLEIEQINLQRDLNKAVAEEQNRKNRISPLQRDQMIKLLDSGSRVNSACADGVSLQNFRISHSEFSGAVALVVANWPQSISKDIKEELLKCAECWSFSLKVWGNKIEYEKTFSGFFVSDTPIPEPLKPLIRTTDYTGAGGEVLKQASWGSLNLGLTVGSTHFENAQSKMLAELNK
jgi:hypothetical protein